MTGHVVEALPRADTRAAVLLFGRTLGFPPPDDARMAGVENAWEDGRSLGIRAADGALAGCAWSFGCRAAVPGGTVPASGVSRVAVRADHTRRGMLTALMHAQLADLVDRGEVLASLRASEAALYGRFGYGVATRFRTIRVRRRGGRGIRADAPTSGPVHLVEPADALEVLRPLQDAVALRRPGGISRTQEWWERNLVARVRSRDHLLVAVHRGPDGDDGFTITSVVDGPEFDARPLVVADLHAADVAAAADLWRFLLDVDLVGAVEAGQRPLDEPLELLLTDPRDATISAVGDETWLRLLDVPAALAVRHFAPAEPVTIAVHDPVLPANAYLGDRRPLQLLATGWWQGDPAAALGADQALATPASPWCGTFF